MKRTLYAEFGREWHEKCRECERPHYHAIVPPFEEWGPKWDLYAVPVVLVPEPRVRLNPHG